MRSLYRYGSLGVVVAGLLATAGGPGGDQAQANSRQNTEASRPAAAVAVRGIDGIKGPKLMNLEVVLQLQHHPPPPAIVSTRAAAMLKPLPQVPPTEPLPPQDERQILLDIPLDLLTGS